MTLKNYISDLLEDRNLPTEDGLAEKYKTTRDVYFSYRSINKVGINPSSLYQETPNAVYCYKLSDIKPKEVPFKGAQGSKFCYFFTVENASVLISDKYSKEQFEKDVQKLRDKKFVSDQIFQEKYLDSRPHGRRIESTVLNFFIIYELTRKLANGNVNKWAWMFRNVLGYDVIEDNFGIIHPSEESQCAIFTSPKIKILEYAQVNNEEVISFSEFLKHFKSDLIDYTHVAKYKSYVYCSTMLKHIKALSYYKKEDKKTIIENIFKVYEILILDVMSLDEFMPSVKFHTGGNDLKSYFSPLYETITGEIDTVFKAYVVAICNLDKDVNEIIEKHPIKVDLKGYELWAICYMLYSTLTQSVSSNMEQMLGNLNGKNIERIFLSNTSDSSRMFKAYKEYLNKFPEEAISKVTDETETMVKTIIHNFVFRYNEVDSERNKEMVELMSKKAPLFAKWFKLIPEEHLKKITPTLSKNPKFAKLLSKKEISESHRYSIASKFL